MKSVESVKHFLCNSIGTNPISDAKIQLDTVGNTQTDVKLLIDSGGSESDLAV